VFVTHCNAGTVCNVAIQFSCPVHRGVMKTGFGNCRAILSMGSDSDATV
jgi:hypothetical protein